MYNSLDLALNPNVYIFHENGKKEEWKGEINKQINKVESTIRQLSKKGKQSRNFKITTFFCQMMDVYDSSETSVLIYQSTRRHIQ
jgi:hypothetical protein